MREVNARLDVDGNVAQPVNGDEVRALAQEFKALGVSAVAVSLLHSYRDPAQEQEVRSIIEAVYPECFISISSDILREYREYERTNTTCLNTALMPLLSNYHAKLEQHLKSQNIDVPFYIMRYGFYEGHTSYRADPIAIACIFGLRSLQQIESWSMPGQRVTVRCCSMTWPDWV